MKADDFLKLTDKQLRESLWAGEHERFSPFGDEERLIERAGELGDMHAEFVLTLYCFEQRDAPEGLLRSLLESTSYAKRVHALAALSRASSVPVAFSELLRRMEASAENEIERSLARDQLARISA
jgi:hypothetical protein